MQRVTSASGVEVSYDRYGAGPPLVLVHGSFSDYRSNWEFVVPLLEKRFDVHAVARRGRGETGVTAEQRLEDQSADVVAVLESLAEPAFLLGHSFGALVALGAAAAAPQRVRRLVLYEPPRPGLLSRESLAPLEALAEAGDWDGFAYTFFRDVLSVPPSELDEVRHSELWMPIREDAPASLDDLRALCNYRFEPQRFRDLDMPVLLQIGSESPRDLYATDALAEVLPDARIDALEGQAHEGMTTAPGAFAQSVVRFTLGS